MAKGKKEERVEAGAPVQLSVTADVVGEVGVNVGVPTVAKSELDAALAKVAQLEKQLDEVAGIHTELTQLKAQLAAEKPKGVSLLDEQKKAVQFCIQWVAHLRRQSRNVQFRQEAQESIAQLGKLL